MQSLGPEHPWEGALEDPGMAGEVFITGHCGEPLGFALLCHFLPVLAALTLCFSPDQLLTPLGLFLRLSVSLVF